MKKRLTKKTKTQNFLHFLIKQTDQTEREREITFSIAKDFMDGIFSVEEPVNLGFGRVEGIELVSNFDSDDDDDESW